MELRSYGVKELRSYGVKQNAEVALAIFSPFHPFTFSPLRSYGVKPNAEVALG